MGLEQYRGTCAFCSILWNRDDLKKDTFTSPIIHPQIQRIWPNIWTNPKAEWLSICRLGADPWAIIGHLYTCTRQLSEHTWNRARCLPVRSRLHKENTMQTGKGHAGNRAHWERQSLACRPTRSSNSEGTYQALGMGKALSSTEYGPASKYTSWALEAEGPQPPETDIRERLKLHTSGRKWARVCQFLLFVDEHHGRQFPESLAKNKLKRGVGKGKYGTKTLQCRKKKDFWTILRKADVWMWSNSRFKRNSENGKRNNKE